MTIYHVCVFAFVLVEVYALLNLGGKIPSFNKLWFILFILGAISLFVSYLQEPPVEPPFVFVALFIVGFILSVTAIHQLNRNFSAGTVTPKKLQTTGLYSYLENPDYLGLLVMVLCLGCMFIPNLILVPFYLRMESVSVQDERKDRIRGSVESKLDSRFWTYLARLFGDAR